MVLSSCHTPSTQRTSAWLSSHVAWISNSMKGKENMKPSHLATQPWHGQLRVCNEYKFNFERRKMTPGDKIYKKTLTYCSTWGIILFLSCGYCQYITFHVFFCHRVLSFFYGCYFFVSQTYSKLTKGKKKRSLRTETNLCFAAVLLTTWQRQPCILK